MFQPDLPLRVTDSEKSILREYLSQNGWSKRQQICTALKWKERKLRDVAESFGAEIIRGQAGLKLTANLHRDEADLALQARDAAISQGKKMIRYGIALSRRIHQLIG